VDIVGHDIGAMVAFSFAVNHPDATRSVSLIDVAHPNEDFFKIPMLAPPGQPVNLWWFAFNQVHGLPEQLLAGRFRRLVDWLFDNLLFDKAAVDDRDRAAYARAYDQPEAIRAGAAWYQAFYQDIEDQKAYGRVTAPMLGIEAAYNDLEDTLGPRGTDVRVVKVGNTGHFVPEEQPDAIVKALNDFLG
jgi:pimeloyl-ACP methyl ester carboxylesterase